MSRTKKWLLVGSALVLIGAIVWVISMSALKWNFYALDTEEYIEQNYVVADGEQITAVELDVDSFPIIVQNGEQMSVKYYECDSSDVEVKVEDGVLKVREDYNFNIFKVGMFQLKRAKLKYVLTVPHGTELNVKGTNTSLRLDGVDMQSLTLRVTNVDVELANCNMGSVAIDATNTDIDIFNSECGALTADSTNLDFSAENSVFDSIKLKGTNVDVDMERVTSPSISIDGTNTDCELERITVNVLFIDGTNLSAEISIAGVESEYTVESHGRRLPPDAQGTDPEKKIVLDGTNNDVKLRFV